ncbi:hypothetical protein MUK42_36860 [Musa troglodytarum]|uniref:Uncharacterized protein n=1 Tax=Musa troglodytarum TaxID=320322 RepID=A0A9E7FL32_9LILI|nr:hypothetical protein MUK42_36860 [Musa troglodytarum]
MSRWYLLKLVPEFILELNSCLQMAIQLLTETLDWSCKN